MGQELLPLEFAPREMLSLPPWSARYTRALGICQWPNEPAIVTLPDGIMMSDAERTEIRRRLVQLETALRPDHPSQTVCLKAKSLVLMRMLMGYSIGSNTDQVADAKISMYLDALEDVPPWAIDVAIKRWGRGDCAGYGFIPNYAYAPPPAHLRAVSLGELRIYQRQLEKLRKLLAAVPVSEAMGYRENDAVERMANAKRIGELADKLFQREAETEETMP